MLLWDSWGCAALCVPSLCGSISLSLSLELVQRGWTMPGAAGQWEQPPGKLLKPQPCSVLLLLCPSCSVNLTTSSVNGWIHRAPPAHEAISWLPDLPLCKGSFASASSRSSPSCSGNAPPQAPASKKAAGAHCSLHITLTDENQLTGL